MLLSIVVYFIPIIIAIVLHEVAHGYTAWILGDDTAKRLRRLSLNPVRHIDVFGTLILPALLLLSQTGIVFGWAKPVPVDFSRLSNPKRDTVLVASAGIVMNIVLAIISAGLLKLTPLISSQLIQGIVTLFLINMVVFNIVLAVFNALPIPPLDGSKILFGWSTDPRIQKFLDSAKAGSVFIIFVAFILPVICRYFGFEFNPFGWYLIKTSQYFISLLI